MLKFDDSPVPPAAIDDVAAIRKSLTDHLLYSVGKDPQLATSRDWYLAAAFALRDRLIAAWVRTMRSYYENDVKRVYYLSMEFLIGRALSNGMINLGLHDAFREASESLGYDLDELQSWEVEPALGNGGLGRLAACLIDSMASLGCPASVMASAMNSGCSRSMSSKAGRSKRRRTGCVTAIPGSSSVPA